MKINWKVRLRHPAFYAAATSFVGFVLVDADVIDVTRFETYVKLLLGVLTAGGVVVDFTTPGVRDSELSMSKSEPIDGEDLID